MVSVLMVVFLAGALKLVAQAQEIDRLKRRVNALEQQAEVPPPPAPAEVICEGGAIDEVGPDLRQQT